MSFAEQRRIVAKVEHLMALVDALETQLAASRATALFAKRQNHSSHRMRSAVGGRDP